MEGRLGIFFIANPTSACYFLRRGLSEGEQKALIEEVIDRCIKENILRDFLTKHREAVVMYSRLAYDE